ncbi:MAG: hypothetical protein HQM12_09970 [SAR324 cluster bacterium]|nr:hypothetical protein [SAR324 cluster bacterium]MBF0351846.1 hypothetical protein [SAR324 cluster bacterium]
MNATEIKNKVEQTLENTVNAVESIHKTLVNHPFELLESVETFKTPVQKARALHDKATESVYNQIRSINKILSNYLSTLIPEPVSASQAKAHSSTAKPANKTKPQAKKTTSKTTAKKA